MQKAAKGNGTRKKSSLAGLSETLAQAQQKMETLEARVDETATRSGQNREGIGFLGEVVWLMSNTPSHRFHFLSDLEWLVVPPVALRQFRVWRKDQYPVAYASWALVSDEVHERFKSGRRRLKPDEWRSGRNLWLIDLVAPMGGAKEMLSELKKVVWEDQEPNFFAARPQK